VGVPPPALTMDNSRGSCLVDVVFGFSKDFSAIVVLACHIFKSSAYEERARKPVARATIEDFSTTDI
jgi:hypothetical protein